MFGFGEEKFRHANLQYIKYYNHLTSLWILWESPKLWYFLPLDASMESMTSWYCSSLLLSPLSARSLLLRCFGNRSALSLLATLAFDSSLSLSPLECYLCNAKDLIFYTRPWLSRLRSNIIFLVLTTSSFLDYSSSLVLTYNYSQYNLSWFSFLMYALWRASSVWTACSSFTYSSSSIMFLV